MDIKDKLKEVLRYEPESGLLFWTNKAHKSVKNKQAGTSNHLGYIVILFQSKPYYAHRLAWLFTYGKFPDQMIDHIDGNTSNNKINNLRDVDNQTNQINRHKPRIDNKCGFMGVSKYRNKWKAQIKRNGVVKYLGLYATPQEAHEIYLKEKNNV